MNRTEELLQELIDLLGGRLGFGDPPYPTKVFVNRQEDGSPWYTFSNEQRHPIPQRALTGTIEKIVFETVERREKETSKIHITVKADRTYILEAGSHTQFTKSFLLSAAQFGPGELKGRLITIVPQEGSDASVLFCRLFVDGVSVRNEQDPNVDMKGVALAAINSVITATRIEGGDPKTPHQPSGSPAQAPQP